MSLSIIYSRASSGLQAPVVTVETHISSGLPNFSIVGLPETTVKESKHRVRSALLNAKFTFPQQRITVNLAPAELPKEGGRFDLAIAIGILMASGQLSIPASSDYEFAGELALSGELRAISGALPFAIATQQTGRKLIIAANNAREVSLIDNLDIHPAKHLLEVCAHLLGTHKLPLYQRDVLLQSASTSLDLCDMRGQCHAKRALEIAAAGGHSLILVGPPGTGKSMLASRLPGILPPMTDHEYIETAIIYSLSKRVSPAPSFGQRPYRAPHHSASSVALVGGGSPPRPGEISMAHNGVLFLDELPEFDRKVLESLREPIESGSICIARAAHQAEFPARFQLIAAMNPCPCGYSGDTTMMCRCSHDQIARYRSKISGPLLDRIDMQIEMPKFDASLLTRQTSFTTESSEVVRDRVIAARHLQLARLGKNNALLDQKDLLKVCQLTNEEQEFMEKAITQLKLSARAYHRVLRVARTIADLAQSTTIVKQHLTEALSYRRFER